MTPEYLLLLHAECEGQRQGNDGDEARAEEATGELH